MNYLSDDQIWKVWNRGFQMVCRPLLFDFWFPTYRKLKISDLALRYRITRHHWGARVGEASHILRKSSDLKLFEKQHGVAPKSNKNNKNNTLAKYAIFGIWHIPTYFAVGKWQPRPNVRHFFFWKGGWVTKIGSGWYLADFRPVEYSAGPKIAKNHNSKSQILHFFGIS